MRGRGSSSIVALLLLSGVLIPILQNTNIPSAEAHNASVATISAYGTPNINGVMSSGEWASCYGPNTYNGNGPRQEGTTTYTVTNEPVVTLTFCEQNDQTNDYYAFQIGGIPSDPADTMYLLFDNLHTGTVPSTCGPNISDDALGFAPVGGGFVDLSYCGLPSPSNYSPPPVTVDTLQDGTGIMSYSTANGYVFEMSHPMNSGDLYDYHLSPGSTFGWCAYFWDANSHHVWDYPVDCYGVYGGTGSASRYGDIKKLPNPNPETLTCDLAINKTMSPNPLVSGQPATITLTVWNNGTLTCGAGAVVLTTVTENIPLGLTATGSPPPGWTATPTDGWGCTFSSGPPLVGPGTVTCTTTTPIPPTTQYSPFATITIPVTVTAPAGSIIHNCAHVDNPLDQNSSNNNSCVDVPVIAGGELVATICVTKFNDLNGNGVQDPGEPGLSGWTINIGNQLFGTTNSTGQVCATVAAPGTYTISEMLQPGWTQTSPPPPGTYTVTVSPGQLVNLSFGNTRGGAAGCDLAINKTVSPNPLQAGQPATFTITFENDGNGTCFPGSPGTTTVLDPIPNSWNPTVVSPIPAGWACAILTSPQNGLSCTSTNAFPPGYVATFTVTATVPNTFPNGGSLTNCASVSNNLNNDANPSNNQFCVTVPILSTPPSGCDLAITKTMTPTSLQQNQQVTITLTVTNVGSAPCAPLNHVQDNLPASLALISPPASPTGWLCGGQSSPPAVFCNSGSPFTSAGPLPPSYTVTFTFSVKATGQPGSYTNCAAVDSHDYLQGGGQGNNHDINPSNDNSCVPFTITSPSPCDRLLNKTITPTSGPSGQTVTIAITVTDVSGACPALSGQGILIADNLPSGMTAVAGSVSTPAGWTCQLGGVPSFYCTAIPAMTYLQTATVSFQATVSGSAGSTITNCAQITNLGDSNSNNNNACATFTITSKCIIATAAYGSELAAPVQFLRNFRDNEVQKTTLGAYFMAAFNHWYYSWAPTIAQQIAPSENYKAAIRVLITPLIGSLYASHIVFAALAAASPELAILSAGLLTSAILGLIYVGPLYALVWKLSKRRITRRTIYNLAIAAAILTFIATLTTGTFNLAANLTALAVVETMLLTPALILRKMTSPTKNSTAA